MDSLSKWIPIDREFPLPGYVQAAIARLRQEGYLAFVVGGSVRDFFLRRPMKDFDLATDASPDELCRIFPEAITVGKAFGVLKVPIKSQIVLEIATFREDLEYTDHRHPSGVRFCGPIEDARRRDFTINALFYDPETKRVLDSIGGVEDLEGRVIRAIGEPNERFREDALRLLRAIRFTTRLGFKLEERTAQAIRECAPLIVHVSEERIRDELEFMVQGPSARRSFQMLSEFGLLERVFAGWDESSWPGSERRPKAWKRALVILEELERENPERSKEVSWAALFLESGSPKLAIELGSRLRMPRAEAKTIAQLIEDEPKIEACEEMREATLLRLLLSSHAEDLLELHRARRRAQGQDLRCYEICAKRREDLHREGRGIPALIDGNDLRGLGLEPGPHFAGILREIEDLALERKLRTREEALSYVSKLSAKSGE